MSLLRLGVRTKLTLLYTTLFAVVLGGAGYVFFHAVALRLDNQVTEEVDARAAGLRGYIKFVDDKPTLQYDRDDPEETHFIRLATRFYQLYDAEDAHIIEQSREMELLDIDLSDEEVAQRVRDPGFDEFDTARDRLRFDNSVLRGPDKHLYLVRIGASLGPMTDTLRELQRILLMMLPAALVIAALGGYFMARFALRPVEGLRTAAHEISISNLDRRLPVRGTNDELDKLARTFNQVFARLQRAVEQMKEFSVSISHELRTPLTALQGETELTLMRAETVEEFRRVMASQLEEFGKLTRLVNELLTLARAESGQLKLERKTVDLGAMARALVEQMEPIARYHNIQLTVDAPEGCAIDADPRWIERVVLNLLDNALKFTPASGRVQVAVGHDDHTTVLTVRDTGVGISSEALPHIFDRFYREEASRNKEVAGVGLGLSLVRSIVLAHGGKVSVESEPNTGSTFRVEFPLVSVIQPTQTPQA